MQMKEQKKSDLPLLASHACAVEAGPVAKWCQQITGHRLFHPIILGVIFLNALIVGLETSQTLMSAHGQFFAWLNTAILSIFFSEIAIRLGAEWPQRLRFFRDGWNLFDFTIVAVSLLPEAGSFATVARLARMLRVTRIISTLPELRLIIGTMLRSIPSMGHVIILLSLLLYVYGIVGYHLFHSLDPDHWGTLGTSLLTLFQMLTLEGWVEIQQASLAVYPWAWLYYASFIIVAVFVVINLFIAVVINNLEAAKAEQREAAEAQHSHAALLRQITELKEQLNKFERTLLQVTVQSVEERRQAEVL